MDIAILNEKTRLYSNAGDTSECAKSVHSTSYGDVMSCHVKLVPVTLLSRAMDRD